MEAKPVEVYVYNPDLNGVGGTVVVTYLESGYRLPIPMIDDDVMTVDTEVQEAFEAGSMFGWQCAWAKPAHEFVVLLLTPSAGTA